MIMNKVSESKVNNLVRHIIKKNGYKPDSVCVDMNTPTVYGNYYTVVATVRGTNGKLTEKKCEKLETLIERALYRHSFTKKEQFGCVEIYS